MHCLSHVFIDIFNWHSKCFRYDEDDACKASRQLTQNLIKWSSTYNINCESEKENKFHTKISEQLEHIEQRMKKRLKCVIMQKTL